MLMRDHVATMSDERPSEVLGALPRTRPHRRSDKRAARPEPTEATTTAAAEDEATATSAASTPEAAATQAPTAKPSPARAPKAKPRATKRAPGPRSAKSSPAGKPRAGKPKASAKPGPAPQRTAARKPARKPLRQPAQPVGTPDARRADKPAPSGRTDVLGTAIQAAGELAEIGISVSARALRRAVSRLPRP
jgi:hypothetical protein